MIKISLPAKKDDNTNEHYYSDKIHFSRRRIMSGSSNQVPASATVEATFIFPIIISLILAFIWMLGLYEIHNAIGARLYEVGNEMVSYSYALSDVFSKDKCDDSIKDELLKIGWNELYVKGRIESLPECGRVTLLTTILSKVSKNNDIDIRVTYYVEPPIKLFNLSGVWLTNHFYSKPYTGYYISLSEDEEDEDVIVYITKYGKVYHTSLNCSALKVTPVKVALSGIEGERNKSGGKYYPCEFCKGTKSTGSVYITPYGDRYHTSENCGAINLEIMKVKLSEVGDRRKCYLCP